MYLHPFDTAVKDKKSFCWSSGLHKAFSLKTIFTSLMGTEGEYALKIGYREMEELNI